MAPMTPPGWLEPPRSRAVERRAFRLAGLIGVPVAGAIPTVLALSAGHPPPTAAVGLWVVTWLLTGVSAVTGRRNAFRNFVPPAGVTYRATDAELGASYASLGLPLADRTFENVLTFKAGGRSFTYFEAVDSDVRQGYLVTELAGIAPTVVARLVPGAREGGRPRFGAMRTDPRAEGFSFVVTPPDQPDFLDVLLNQPMSRALALLDVSQWRTHGRLLVGCPWVNTASKSSAWERLRLVASQMAKVADAIPSSLMTPDDPSTSGRTWPTRPPGA